MTIALPLAVGFGEISARGGILIVALVAAGCLLSHQPRRRAYFMVAALALAPGLLAVTIWDAPQLQALRGHLLLVLAGIAVGLLVVVLLAFAMRRKSWLMVVLLIATLPFRIPIAIGPTTANLLVPLYLVLGSGAVAFVWECMSSSQHRFTFAAAAEQAETGAIWLQRLLAATLVLYALQAVYSLDPLKALQQMVFFYVPFTLLFVLVRDLRWNRQLLNAGVITIIGLAVVFALFGMWEYYTHELLLNPKVISANAVEDYFRVNSLFLIPISTDASSRWR